MKNLKVISGFVCASAVLAMAGCSDSNSDFSASGKGRVAPLVEVNSTAKAPKGRKAPASRVDYDQVTASMLSLKLIPDDASQAPQTWNAVADFPADKEFPIGKYTMEAFYGTEGAEGFDVPYYKGSSQFYVRENQTTSVAVTATLQQAMVTVDYTDAFKSYVTDYSAEILSDGSASTVAYAPENAGQLAYMTPGKLSVYVNFSVPNKDEAAKVKACEFDAQARYIYNVSVDYRNGELGTGQLAITISDELGTEEVTVDISDELFTTKAPEITTSGFTSGTALSVVAGDNAPEPLKATIVAMGDLAEVNLSTNAPALIQAGWPASANLLNIDANTQNAMKALGFDARGLWKNPEKMALLDFTDVVKHLTPGTGDKLTNEFILTVVDKNGKACEPVSLLIDVEKPAVNIVSVADVSAGDTEITVDVDYNGNNFRDNAQFEVTNPLGTWSKAEIVSVAPVSRASRTWRAVLKVQPVAGQFKLRVTLGTGAAAATSSVTVKPGVKFTVPAGEVWASRAKMNVTDGVSDLTSKSYYWVSTDGSNYTAKSVDANGYITGLTPSTDYYVKASADNDINGARGPVSITTEAAAQLENADMESWTVEQVPGHSEYQKLATCGGPWATVNELTTSEGGTGNSFLSYGGSAYRAFSGTWPANQLKAEGYSDSDDIQAGHNGESAYISTVGWGSGNTSFGTGGKCENVTAGELFLGSYDISSRTAGYGIPFGSRPLSLSFYCQYRPKSSADFGTAEISVLDASGNVIGTGSLNITSRSAYELVTVPVTYSVTNESAATLRVTFRSSGNADCLKWTSDCLNDPGTAKYHSERYKGSELYIDDITLNY